ncbi:MAG TPA: archaetidylserine decarboxylase [Spirochaetota bacterium]|nr:phosphatidylserine decarboxylase [Spirochaetota bacterium]HOD13957.1 archaetidylserine decarboxylase [Spirochaetota bacterium]HPG49737.1 archaetidylserine decarboxylase [Spirochaetota bacterium]HPN11920.1 archaetidylserine decarboxylase [Spirochaetota bacterium]
MKNRRPFSLFAYRLLPKSLMSRAFGYLARLHLPRRLLESVISWYSAKYGVINEYITPAGGFRTLDDFFTRKMKEGTHPVDSTAGCVVSPVDARIDRYGNINDTTIIQAKGIDYSVRDLIPSDTYRKFLWGDFMTLYLSPGDYHRIHSPVTGALSGYFNIPGTLYTVQEWMVNGLGNLFIKNERLVSYIECPAGTVGVCKIGALNVGRITLSYSDITTNKTFRRLDEKLFASNERIPVRAGDELGAFHLGSTIILLFQKGAVTFDSFAPGTKIRMGARIGRLNTKS